MRSLKPKEQSRFTIKSSWSASVEYSCFLIMETDDTEQMTTTSCVQRFLLVSKKCNIPPYVGRWLTRFVVGFVLWATTWSIVGRDALPGGNIYSLSILLAVAALAGFLVRIIPWLRLPSLLGMLIAGFILRNVDGIDVAKDINADWSLTIRNIALVVILLRSGLGLDQNVLKKAKWTISRLALLPCISEAIAVAVMGHLLLDMGFLWSFQLGYVGHFRTIYYMTEYNPIYNYNLFYSSSLDINLVGQYTSMCNYFQSIQQLTYYAIVTDQSGP